MKEKHNILCVGRVYCDLVFSGVPNLPRAGQETYADGLEIFAGGGAFITAAYFAASGGQPGLCAMLPNGPFGASISDELTRSGVDLFASRRAAPDQQPQVTAVILSPDDRAFLTRRTGPALPENYATALAAPNLTHLHIAELATLIEYPDLIKIAKQNHLTISLDCAWDETVMAAHDSVALMSGVDIFLPNRPELLKIAKLDNDLQKAAEKLLRTVPLIVVKCGADGAKLWHRNGETAMAKAPASSEKDSTGAGDAFNAGFLLRWLENAAYAECLENGNRLGSTAIGALGGATAALKTG